MPSLFSFRLCAGGLLDASLAGVSHADVSLTLPPPPPPPPPPAAPGAAAVPSKAKGGGKKRRRGAAPVQSRGPLLVTHRGVSGPAALKLSAFGATQLHEAGYRGTLRLNLAPGLAPAEARAALQAFQNREARRAPRAPPRAPPRPRRPGAVAAPRPPCTSAPAPCGTDTATSSARTASERTAAAIIRGRAVQPPPVHRGRQPPSEPRAADRTTASSAVRSPPALRAD